MTDVLDRIVSNLSTAISNILDRLETIETRDPEQVLSQLTPNGDFELWPFGNGPFTTSGATIVPGWTMIESSSSGSISRESTVVDAGSVYAAAVTYTHAAGGTVRLQSQALRSTMRDRPLALSARVRSTCPVRLFVSYDGGSTFAYGDYNKSLLGDAWETLTLLTQGTSSASAPIVGLEFSTSSGVCYVDNVFLIEADGAMDATSMPVGLDEVISGYVTFREVPSMATPAANTGVIYTKDSGGVSTPYWKNDAGSEFNLLNPTALVPSALTRADDTNVTLTLNGSPTNALLAATEIAVGWTGTLAVARGGTGSGTAAGARTNLGLDAGGAGDIWVEKAGDTMTGALVTTAITLSNALAISFTNTAARIVPGSTSLVIRDSADTVDNFFFGELGNFASTRNINVGSSGADAESIIRRDNATTTFGSTVTTISLRNQNITDGNWLGIRFVSADTGATIRNAGYVVMNIITHGAASVTATMVFQTANASATPATRMTLGASGEGADIVGSSTILVSATQKNVLSLISTATNDDPREDFVQGRVATTNNTQTTINTIATTTGTVIEIEATVIARQTAASGAGTVGNGAGYVVRGTYRNVGGTVTLIGAVQADYTAEDEAGWDATLTISGTNVLLRVTGATNETITWHSHYRVRQLGS